MTPILSTVREVANKFDVPTITKIRRYGSGIINETYLVLCADSNGSSKFILQKQHLMIGEKVNDDIRRVTAQMSSKGMKTFKLIPVKANKYFLKDALGGIWRMRTFIPGVTYERMPSVEAAFEAGKLLGTFHKSLNSLSYNFKHRILNFHNTRRIINNLAVVTEKNEKSSRYGILKPLQEFVSSEYTCIDHKRFKVLPQRIVHGDPKVNNIVWDENGMAVSFIDLDTLMKGPVYLDLGDVVRTWCNREKEGSHIVAFDRDVFEKFMKGYLTEAHTFITTYELETMIDGVKLMILESIARFVIDGFQEKYFRLDEQTYSSLLEQNVSKARTNISLYNDFIKHRNFIEKTIENTKKDLS